MFCCCLDICEDIDFFKLKDYPEIKMTMPHIPECKEIVSVDGVQNLDLLEEANMEVPREERFDDEFEEVIVANLQHQKVEIVEEKMF